MDIVTQKRLREWTLLTLVGLMALVANLPKSTLDKIGIETSLLMAVLGLLVVLALFLYVRFYFFLLYTLLAVGANLPERWAEGLGISQGPLLATLISMVSLSLLNYGVKMLPSGLEKKKSKPNPEATQVLINAIERGNLSYLKTVLTMEFDLDEFGQQGMTPLMCAAQRGDIKIVDMLLTRGAVASIAGTHGRAQDVALQNNFPAVAERLRSAEEAEQKQQGAVAAEPTDKDSELVG